MKTENKETFQLRLKPYFSPSDQLDIKLAYVLAKFGHRSQFRKEIIDGNHVRYFEHVRRVALVLIDEMKIMDHDMIIAALLHDSIEDCDDLSPELLEHTFNTDIVSIIKLLSKVPEDGYIERLSICNNWKALAIKACDRLDNLRSLMIPGTTIEFQKKQVLETKVKYFPLFDYMLTIAPKAYVNNLSIIRDEIRRLIERYSVIIELREAESNSTLM